MIAAAVKKRIAAFQLDAELKDSGYISVAGRNGAGKTTLLRAIAGLIKVDSGYVNVGGREVTRVPPEERGIVYVSPSSFVGNMTVERHLLWGAQLRRVEVSREDVSAVRTELGVTFGGRVGELSLGMKVRVSLATALISRPNAILVDEVFSNLHEREEFTARFKRLAAGWGIDIVEATHEVDKNSVADHVYLLEEGRTIKKV